jgi:ATP-dependent RNA helicase RhlE
MSEETPTPKEKKYYDNISMGQRTSQSVYFVAQHDKASMLERYLQNADKKRTVVVVQSKMTADELSARLNEKNVKSAAAHGNHRPEQLQAAAKAFNDGEIGLLITTDMILLALGLENVELLVNFDLPLEAQSYFKRLRFVDEVGQSVLYVKPDDEKAFSTIEYMMRGEIAEVEMEGFEPTPHAPRPKDKTKKPRHKTVRIKAARKAAIKSKWVPSE